MSGTEIRGPIDADKLAEVHDQWRHNKAVFDSIRASIMT